MCKLGLQNLSGHNSTSLTTCYDHESVCQSSEIRNQHIYWVTFNSLYFDLTVLSTIFAIINNLVWLKVGTLQANVYIY